MHEINPTESVPGPVPPPVEQSSRAVKSPPALNDPWYSGGLIPLDGVLERNGFSPLITIFGGLIIGLVLFQGISTVLTFVYILGIKGVPFSDFQADLEGVLVEYAGPLIIFNSVGQVLGLLIPGLLFARMHSSKPFQFLRLRKTDIRYVLLSLLGLIAVFPIVQWIGGAVDSLPWPESVRAFEKAQTDMIQNILDQNFSLPFAISMMALTPAICEEVLFRGYVQRQSERIMGIAGGILFSGMIFGLYHLRPTQAIPLGLLGVYMAYITWRTGSLVPAITVHLANNAFAIFLGKYIQSQGQTAVDLESIQIPFVFVVVGTLLLAGVIYIFWRMADDDAALHKQAITSGSEVNAETQRES